MRQLRVQAQNTVNILMLIFFVSLVFLVSCEESESESGPPSYIYPIDPIADPIGDPVVDPILIAPNFSSLTFVASSFGDGPTVTKTIEISSDGTLNYREEEDKLLNNSTDITILQADFTAQLSDVEMEQLIERMNAVSLDTQTDIDLSGCKEIYPACDYTTDYDITYVSDLEIDNSFNIITYCLRKNLSDDINEFIDYVYELVVTHEDDQYEDDEGLIHCTAETVPSVNVYVYDKMNGDIISDATVTLTSGDFNAVLNYWESEYNGMTNHVYSGVYEYAGTFELTVEKDDYITHVQEVEVASGVCHVVTEEVTVNLFPAPLF